MNVQARNPDIDKLVAEISRYRKKHGVSKTAFGAWAVKDPNFLRDLEAGREPRWSTIKAIRDKMAGAAQ